MTDFFVCFIQEPDLIFGHQREERDPKIGLKHFGPYFSRDEEAPSPMKIRIGIVGNGVTISLAKRVLDLLGRKINSEEPNRWLYPDYPGFKLETEVRCQFTNSDSWNETIKAGEIAKIIKIPDSNERITAATDLFIEKIRKITLEDSLPRVIICALPLLIEEYCGITEKTRDAKKAKFSTSKKLSDQNNSQKLLEEWIVGIKKTEC
jgi:hypothetical protein